MRKVYKLHDLDCANCAAKMENAVRKIDGVQDCSVNFLTQKMIIECPQEKLGEIVKKAVAVCKKIEPDCVIEV